jgi:diaminohydroxyphosphoribosylaminopyrimidine deaminase/5-amino-6-(5-phosphoribosylamino)uracil reductase
MFSAADHAFMARALQLARLGLNGTTPNPRVGCVVVKDGAIVGEGWHARAGESHAEVNALRAAAASGHGATVYVSLEPCCHHGRTPPCSDALIEAGVARVIAAMADPNPQVSGAGMAHLAAAGIETACGLLEDEAREINLGFVSRMTRGRPWLRLKVAASLDGKTALDNGISQWITSREARRDGHAWRARACAILTGGGTIRDDNPSLTVRDVPATRQPLRVVADSHLETPLDARVLDGGQALIAAAIEDEGKIAALRGRGAEVVVLPDGRGKVDLPALMLELGRRGINELHGEAGFKLNGSLLRAGLVDELLIYLAPCLIGSGRDMFNLPQLTDLSGKRAFQIRDLRRVGADIRILARFE